MSKSIERGPGDLAVTTERAHEMRSGCDGGRGEPRQPRQWVEREEGKRSEREEQTEEKRRRNAGYL